MRIYLDHNAGSPMRPAVRDAIADGDIAGHGNPASIHRAGQRARRALEQAREQVAALVDAVPRAIVFTSGGTESNNLAILGAALSVGGGRKRIVATAIEHSSVMAPLAELEGRGFEVIRISPDRDGCVDPEVLAAAIGDDVALVTLGLVNAEVGAIQEVTAISRATSQAGALFHLDAAQAVGRIPVRVEDLGCDLMTISAHKIGGPAGIGALYVRPGINLAPTMLGGPQESGMRAGTPNLLGAIGFGVAAEAVSDALEDEHGRIEILADALLNHLLGTIPGLRLNGRREGRVANTLNLTFPGVLGESMLIALDLEGVEVSMGSACAAGAVEPSHVLTAMGRSAAEARSSLRISLGWSTSAKEIADAAEIIARVWRRVANAEPADNAEAAR
ncbi:MAG: cysteine desulfurase [Candidatus Binataceae bacterium]|jgi:cysteine desulfurase|nr:cysteine desulfurase [Candidatus Binataceae bacterium]